MILKHLIRHVEQKGNWNMINKIGTRELSTQKGGVTSKHHQQRTGTQPGWGMFMAVGISQKSENGLCVWWGGVGELALPEWCYPGGLLGAAGSTAGRADAQPWLGPDCLLPVPGLCACVAPGRQREKGLGGSAEGQGKADPAPSELHGISDSFPTHLCEQTLRLRGEETEAYARVSETCWAESPHVGPHLRADVGAGPWVELLAGPLLFQGCGACPCASLCDILFLPVVLLPMSFRAAAGMWFHLFSDCWDGGGMVAGSARRARRPRGGATLCRGARWAALTPAFVFLAAAPWLVTRLRGRRAAGTWSLSSV